MHSPPAAAEQAGLHAGLVALRAPEERLTAGIDLRNLQQGSLDYVAAHLAGTV